MRFFALTFLLALSAQTSRAEIMIVAAENFYGGLAEQIGGGEVKVTSILSNPNQDPHEFTSNASTAKAVADADIVIYNGLGYDGWMDKLLGIAGKKNRVVIRVADLIGSRDGDNPHIWYDPRTMPALAEKLDVVLQQGSSDAPVEKMTLARSQAFNASMIPVTDKITEIKNAHRNIPVTATEPVFGYMATALGFKMLNYNFQVNVMNDTEPSASQTAAFEKSLRSHTAKLLFYNSQVNDPTTDRLKKAALQAGVLITA